MFLIKVQSSDGVVRQAVSCDYYQIKGNKMVIYRGVSEVSVIGDIHEGDIVYIMDSNGVTLDKMIH